MGNLFKHGAFFTDLHLGAKANSQTHNQDCIDFINWFIKEAKERGCETCFMLGDYHHNRNTMNISTMKYSLESLRLLSDNFEKVYFIAGNHDIYYREKRDVHSLKFAEEFDNIVVIDEPFNKGDVAIVPWLVGDEWKKIGKMKAKYLFGHFEIPGFKMNASIVMPDHGGINRKQFGGFDYVFSGHFHYRQNNGNVHYIGNAFPHNYGDAGDRDRGAMFLEWDGKPEFANWDDMPTYTTANISEVIASDESMAEYLKPKGSIKMTLDIDLSYEQSFDLRDKFMKEFGLREVKYAPFKDVEINEEEVILEHQSVEEIVLTQLQNIESETIDINKLINIFNGL